jgi:hypothetical protein
MEFKTKAALAEWADDQTLGELLNELNSHFASNLQSKKLPDGHHLGRSGARRSPKTSRARAAQQVQERPATANGSTEPYPIPWLDKNGSHNQPAGPNLEPALECL